jgi:choline dehydrogenase-like flavoprotein
MHADVLIIGAGPAGGALARALAPTGADLLVVERGGFLPREAENWDPALVYRQEHYTTEERWRDGLTDEDFRASMIYRVGGNSKCYGSALLRMREADFDAFATEDGPSPAWPISYADLAPYYDRAEADYHVHGARGADPTGPPGPPYPHAPIPHSDRIAEVGDRLAATGLRPFALPMGVARNAVGDDEGPFVLREVFRAAGRETFDSYPDLTHHKADAETCGVRPALGYDNVRLRTGVMATRLVPSATGHEIEYVEAEIDGRQTRLTADVVVLACGAVNTAALLLRSDVANGSGRVGRHLMKHLHTKLYAVDTATPNETYFQKTLAVNDFYWGDAPGGDGHGRADGTPWPLGHVHLMGKHLPEMIAHDLGIDTDEAAGISRHSVDWWVQTEDLPRAEHRVRLDAEGRIAVEWRPTNAGAHARLLDRFEAHLRAAGFDAFHRKPMPLRVMNHQCGTARMSADPAEGVVDVRGRSHEVANLWIADASVFPSSSATNPTLTIVANAYRTADRIAEALGSHARPGVSAVPAQG